LLFVIFQGYRIPIREGCDEPFIEPGRTIEVACFMRFSLLTNTDRLLLMVRRRVADLWRRASKDANRVLIHWADLYRELLASVGALASDPTVADSEVRE
jgi:hypothetical protein